MSRIYEPAELSPAADFYDVRREIRDLITKLLATIGTTCLFSFGLLALFSQKLLLGTLLLGCGAFVLLSLIYLLRGWNNSVIASSWTAVTAFLCVILLYTGGVDNTGLFWIYPNLMIGMLLNRIQVGLIYFCFCEAASVLLMMTPLNQLLLAEYTTVESIRFVVTLAITGVGCLICVYFDEKSHRHMAGLHKDVSKMASFDSLTGLANRRSFRAWLSRVLSRQSARGSVHALLYIDLDDFKQVNDRHGHTLGDRILKVFSERLVEKVRATDITARVDDNGLSRLAGDEFAVVLTDLSAPADAGLVAERLLDLFDGGFEVDGQNYPISASIGIAVSPQDATSAELLIHHADAAMYRAKHGGKNRYHFFTQEIAEAISQRKLIEDGLREALAQDAFSLVYMPMFACHSLAVVGVEVLLRTQSPKLAGFGPDQFIPVAEETGLIKALDYWVIDHAFIRLKQLQTTQGFRGRFCINISAVELHNQLFPKQVEALLRKHQIDPASVELEITETSLVVDDEQSIALLEELKSLGLSLALDDFGTGYTAFNQLSSYPVDCLKIDRSFVSGLFSEQQSKQKMVPIIQSLADLYGLRVIAEGVENAEQLAYLKSSGCDWAQGYHLSKPLPWEEFVALLSQQRSQSRAS